MPGLEQMIVFRAPPIWIRWTLPAVLSLGLGGCADGPGLLGPDAAQGIDGTVLLGPICPVISEENPCPDRPYEAWIVILDHRRRKVGRISSYTDGRFRVGLEPGTYILDPESGDPYPVGEEEVVEVAEGVYSSVTLYFDSGIR